MRWKAQQQTSNKFLFDDLFYKIYENFFLYTNIYMTFNIILTTDINNGISKYNKMPWNSVDDLQFFNKHTMNNICIMGYLRVYSI